MSDARNPSMGADRETRVVRSWLHEERHEDATRVLGAALEEVATNPVRRTTRWSAWRTLTMNKFVAAGLGVAAVVVVLIVGSNLLGSSPSPGGEPSPSVAPSEAPSDAASAEPSLAAGPGDFAAVPVGTILTPGDWAFTHIPGVTVVFTVEDGRWHRNEPNAAVYSYNDGPVAELGAGTTANLYVDPCQPELGLLDPPVGPTVDDLAAALEAVPGLTFTAPEPVTQDGVSGVRMDYVPPDGFNDCADDVVFAVGDDGGEQYAPRGDSVLSFYIYDVDGTRVVIGASFIPSRTDELNAMLESIRFE